MVAKRRAKRSTDTVGGEARYPSLMAAVDCWGIGETDTFLQVPSTSANMTSANMITNLFAMAMSESGILMRSVHYIQSASCKVNAFYIESELRMQQSMNYF